MVADDDLAQAVRGALAAAGLLGASTADGEDARAASAAPQPAPGRAAGEGGDAGSAHVWTRVVVLAMREVLRATGAPEAWVADDRERVVASLDDAARLIEAAKAPVLVAHEESGAWVRPGVRSFEAYRAAQGREDLGASRREAATARTVTALEGGVDAMARGELTSSQAQHLGRVADKVDPDTRSLLLQGEGAAKVRELARTHEPRRPARAPRTPALSDSGTPMPSRRSLRRS